MISRETCEKIWHCWREIETGQKLLEEINNRLEEAKKWDRNVEKLKDAFGRERNLQLGIPSGENAYRLYDVQYELATSVIRAHIASKEALLKQCQEEAVLELQAYLGEKDADEAFKDPAAQGGVVEEVYAWIRQHCILLDRPKATTEELWLWFAKCNPQYFPDPRSHLVRMLTQALHSNQVFYESCGGFKRWYLEPKVIVQD
jgi:hypothetical protein